MVHLNERVNSGFIADAVGCGDEVAVGGKTHLAGAGDDPLRVGGGEVSSEDKHSRSDTSGIDHLPRGVLRVELDGMRALAQLRDPLGTASQKAPVVGDSNGVDGIDVRGGLSAGIDKAVLRVSAGNDGGHAHVEVGVCLGLGVHTCIAVDESGDEEFAGAVDDSGVFGNGNLVGQANVSDAAVADDDNGARDVARGVAPGRDVDDSAAGENQWRGGWRGLRLRLGRNRGQRATDHEQTREKVKQAHERDSLMRIVAQRGKGSGVSGVRGASGVRTP